jgi:hypothetical protein
MQFDNKMYCDISRIAQNPLWKRRQSSPDDEPDQYTPEMLDALRKAVQPLLKILSNAGCQPSMT